MNPRALLAFALAVLPFAGSATAANTPKPFTARYAVSQGGQPMGVATVTLRAGPDGSWILRKDTRGTAGLAALLGASTQETSRFRWQGTVPEAISYDYHLVAAGKDKQRHLRVDWSKHQVSVQDGKHDDAYAAQLGMVERNTLPLAIGLALQSGKQPLSLPVGVRQAVETENFKVAGNETVKVPAGSYPAERVEHSDDAQGFSAWYVPQRYPLPVKLAQREGGDLVMELVSYSQP